jgi:RND family efflux transporter MFP subunit
LLRGNGIIAPRRRHRFSYGRFMNKRFVVSLVVIILVAAGAWHLSRPDERKAVASAPRAISVTTVPAKRMDVPVRLSANGYVSPLNSVDIRPQVSSVIARVHIKEGQFVKAGDLLFSLDDRADRVNLQKAQAQLAKDQANLADLERQFARSRDLLGKGFISQSATDTVQSQLDAQRAALQADRAAVEAARVSLGYDVIRATSAGRAGAISVYPGSLVQPASPPLVTISQLDPIAVTFTLPESELNGLLAVQKSGGAKVVANLQQAGEPAEGRLSFIDNAVDPQNGTIKVKAVFPNADHRLWPGQYVTVNTVVREMKDAVVIPQAAVITTVDAKTVYVIGDDRTAQARRVALLYSFGTQAVVSGVKAGDRIVVEGKQNLRPGNAVSEAGAAKRNETGSEQKSPR